MARHWILWLAVSLYLPRAEAASVPVGDVQEVAGTPEVLRNPVKKPSKSWRQAAEKRGYVVAAYDGQFWESYQVIKGMKLFYGDRLSTNKDEDARISLDDGIEIKIAPDTIIKLSRIIIKEQNQTTVERWVSLISGAIRAKAQKSQDENRTKFRSGSIAMGVRGTEFVIENRGTNSKLLTLEGEVAVRDISPEEQQLFDSYTDQMESSPVAAAGEDNQARQLQRIAKKSPEISVRAGMKVEAPNQSQPMGMALTDQPTAPTKLEPQSIGTADFEGLSGVDLSPNQKISAEPKAQDKKTPSTTNDRKHLTTVYLARLNLDAELSDGGKPKFESTGLGLDYRWLFHRNLDIGAFLVRTDELNGNAAPLFPGTINGRFESPMTLMGIRLSGRLNFSKWMLGAGFNILSINNLDVKLDSPNLKKTVTIDVSINPMISFMASYRMTESLHLLAEVGGTNLSLNSRDPTVAVNFAPDDEHGFSVARLGVGWGF